MNTTALCRVSVAAAAIFALVGCDREPAVTQTSQPKDSTVATAPQMPQGAGNPQLPPDHPPVTPGMQMPGMGEAKAPGIAYTVPAGWKEDRTPRPMREATLLIGEGDKGAELVVTRLSGQFGEFGANINRWRGQVGLGATDDAGKIASRDVKSSAGELKVYELEGPTKKMLVGILKQGDATWFFKLTGDKATVTQNTAAFDQFLQSLRTSE